MGTQKTHYEILEVRDNASPEVIKMAYKALCLKYHPDTTKLGTQESYSHMQKINVAYEVLSNKDKRLIYDSQLGYSYKKTQSSRSDTAAQDATRSEARRRQEEAARAEARRRQEEAARTEASRRQEDFARAEDRRRQEEAKKSEARRREADAAKQKGNVRAEQNKNEPYTIKEMLKRRIVFIPLIIFGSLIFVLFGIGFTKYEMQVYENNPTYFIQNAKIGKVVQYGFFEQDGDIANGKEPLHWMVFEIEEGKKATLVCTSILHYKKYAKNSIDYIPWDESQLKRWLEVDFAYTMSSKERKWIVDYRIPNVTELDALYEMGWKCKESKYVENLKTGQTTYKNNCWWITPESGSVYEYNTPIVNESGDIDYDSAQKTDWAGIVPVITIQLYD